MPLFRIARFSASTASPMGTTFTVTAYCASKAAIVSSEIAKLSCVSSTNSSPAKSAAVRSSSGSPAQAAPAISIASSATSATAQRNVQVRGMAPSFGFRRVAAAGAMGRLIERARSALPAGLIGTTAAASHADRPVSPRVPGNVPRSKEGSEKCHDSLRRYEPVQVQRVCSQVRRASSARRPHPGVSLPRSIPHPPGRWRQPACSPTIGGATHPDIPSQGGRHGRRRFLVAGQSRHRHRRQSRHRPLDRARAGRGRRRRRHRGPQARPAAGGRRGRAGARRPRHRRRDQRAPHGAAGEPRRAHQGRAGAHRRARQQRRHQPPTSAPSTPSRRGSGTWS